MLRFLRMGFLTPWTNELVFDSRLAGSEFCCELKRFDAGCIGPYSQVTSTSFSLCVLLVRIEEIRQYAARAHGWGDRQKTTGVRIEAERTHQFKESGVTVFSLN